MYPHLERLLELLAQGEAFPGADAVPGCAAPADLVRRRHRQLAAPDALRAERLSGALSAVSAPLRASNVMRTWPHKQVRTPKAIQVCQIERTPPCTHARDTHVPNH